MYLTTTCEDFKVLNYCTNKFLMSTMKASDYLLIFNLIYPSNSYQIIQNRHEIRICIVFTVSMGSTFISVKFQTVYIEYFIQYSKYYTNFTFKYLQVYS